MQPFNLGSSPGKPESTRVGASDDGGGGFPLPLHISFAHHTLSSLPPASSSTTARSLRCNPCSVCPQPANQPFPPAALELMTHRTQGSKAQGQTQVNLEFLALKCR